MKREKLALYLLIAVLSAVLILSAAKVVSYAGNALQQKNAYDDLAALVEQARLETEAATDNACTKPEPESSPTEVTEPSILPEYTQLYEKNADTVGWLKIEGTSVNYPVLQSPGRKNYYLNRDFSGEDSTHGCLYAREGCDVFAPSDNVTIYGHHMRDGSMFASLKNFRSQSFWEKYHTIDFDTLYERNHYTVFAVFTTTVLDGGFAYYRFDDAEDAAEFDEFVATCKSMSLYDTGITPVYGDKLLCLSTCEYTNSEGRLVVVAVRNNEESDAQKPVSGVA